MSFKDLSDAVVGTLNGVFGDSVTYIPSAGPSETITAIFDNTWVEVAGVVSFKPTLRLQLSNLKATPDKGDEVKIDSDTYRVMESREDGYGGSTLILQKV